MRVWVNCDGVLCFIKTLHKLCKAKPDNSTCALLNTILQMLQIAINNEKKCPDFESIPLENYNINLKNVQRMMDNRLYIKFKHEVRIVFRGINSLYWFVLLLVCPKMTCPHRWNRFIWKSMPLYYTMLHHCFTYSFEQ